MIILTQQSGGTFTAQIRSSHESGFRVLYRASCTESEAAAACAAVVKFFGMRAVASIEPVPKDRIAEHVPNSAKLRRSNPVSVWTFNPRAR